MVLMRLENSGSGPKKTDNLTVLSRDLELPGRDPKKSRNLIAVFGDMGNER